MSDLTITHAGSTVTQTRQEVLSNNKKLNQMAVDLIDVTLTTTSGTHGDDTIVSHQIEIPNAVAVKGGAAIIQSIILSNTDDSIESPALELIFTSNSLDLSGGGGTPVGDAISVTDANVHDKILGAVTISNWSTFKPSSSEIALKANIGMVVKADSTTRSIYVGVINRSGAAYTPSDTDKLQMKIGIVKD